MTARPPPAHPHIGINPSTHFSSLSTTEWAEDDAWDSGSDSESPASRSSWKPTIPSRSSSSTTAPRPVPKPVLNSSSSTLASSYTHLHAPSPSSYPPKVEQAHPAKNGWTIVRKSADRRGSIDPHNDERTASGHVDTDVDGDLILGEMEPEPVAESSMKSRSSQGSVRKDVDDVVNGTPTFRCGSIMPSLSRQILYMLFAGVCHA